MALTTSEITRIQGYSAAEARSSIDYYNTANTAGGTKKMMHMGSLFQARILTILLNELPAQLAAKPLIPPAYQTVADDMNTYLMNGDGPGTPDYENISAWTTQHPPAVVSWSMGEFVQQVDIKDLPSISVTAAIPGGTDDEYPSVGLVQKQVFTCYVQYRLPWQQDIKRQMEALCGIEAAGDVLLAHPADTQVFWQNGKVKLIQNNTIGLQSGSNPNYSEGTLMFTAEHWGSYKLA